MSQGIQFIDIIFLALVAGFLVLRLRSVLGRRTGNEKRPENYGFDRQQDAADGTGGQTDNVVELPNRRSPRPDMAVVDEDDSGLTQVRLADPSFDVDEFLAGARAAFEMIVEAFAKGDLDTLRPLLADEVYADFEAAVRDRESRGETMETEIISIQRIEMAKAEMRQRVAHITVRFVSEQMTLIKDSEGRVIEGDPTSFETVTDDWTFARDTTSGDPNWQLVATSTPEE